MYTWYIKIVEAQAIQQLQIQQTTTAFAFYSFCESNLSTENHLNAIEILNVENCLFTTRIMQSFGQCFWQLAMVAEFTEGSTYLVILLSRKEVL